MPKKKKRKKRHAPPDRKRKGGRRSSTVNRGNARGSSSRKATGRTKTPRGKSKRAAGKKSGKKKKPAGKASKPPAEQTRSSHLTGSSRGKQKTVQTLNDFFQVYDDHDDFMEYEIEGGVDYEG